MTQKPFSERFEKLVVRDERFSFTLVSVFAVLMIFINLNLTNLLLIGAIASILYFLINGTFLGCVFFKGERFVMKLLLGDLVLLALLGFVSWATVVISNLGVANVVIVLLAVTAFSSLLNRLKASARWR